MAKTAYKSGDASLASALQDWRQGDFALNVSGFIHIQTLENGAEGDVEIISDDGVEGVVVVSQTCDVVNCTTDKSFVTVCPLVEITPQSLKNVTSGRTAVFASIENAPRSTIVADLTRMMTVTKELLASWKHHQGFSTESEQRKFAFALERKHGRFAFPNSFATAMQSLRNRAISKHSKEESETGKIYRSIKEFRIRAAPDWKTNPVEVAFIVILEDKLIPGITKKMIYEEISKQLDKLTLPEQFVLANPAYQIATYDDYTAREYAFSQPLDFDFLTISKPPK